MTVAGGFVPRGAAGRVLVGGVVVAVVVSVVVVVVGRGGDGGGPVIIVEGARPAETSIPVGSDRRASDGVLLELDTAEDPPAEGWYATYEVVVPEEGVYELGAVATAPMEQAHTSEYGSFFSVAVNGGEAVEVAGSQPRWATSPPAWGDLSELTLDDVELRRGTNTITFAVDRPTVATGSPTYRLLLDQLMLRPTELAVKAVHVGDPAVSLGVYGAGETADLRVVLNGRARREATARYEIHDYFEDEVASGTVTVAAGEVGASVELPDDLPPGNYRAVAALDSSGGEAVGHFARLPDQEPVRGEGSRFGVNGFVSSVVPPSRLDAFASAMARMGVGYVRDGNPAPADPAARAGDDQPFDDVIRSFHVQGIRVLEVVAPRPDWETTDASAPLPADLLDAYHTGRHLADAGADRPDAVQSWNEPDIDATASTGDQHAAYVKALALGLADGEGRPVRVLSGIAGEDNGFQELMLQNGVARYVDAWAFHTYPDPAEQDDPEFPGSEEQHELRRLHGDGTAMWATESGVFLTAEPGGELDIDQQRLQARYLVHSTVEDLAAGTDRRFWFIGASTYDGGYQFGLLSPELQPWPAYSAHAALAAILGEADFVDHEIDLSSYTFRFTFDNGGRAVTVLWAAGPTEVDVPVPGSRVDVYDIMGRRIQTLPTSEHGTVEVAASLDPIYLVSDVPAPAARPRTGEPTEAPDQELTAADRIVLSQRYDPDNAAPGKDDGDARTPLGYRLDATTPMSLDVYNLGDTPQTVNVTGRAYGGWSVDPAGPATVEVPARGRVSVPFTVTAAEGVEPGVDYPLVFEATLDGEGRGMAPPSVARIQLPADEPGEPVPLAPSIQGVSPADGASVTGPRITVAARVTDQLSGVDPDRVTVELDGEPVPSRYDPATGRLTASLDLTAGRYQIWIRAVNTAHAPAQASVTLTVR